MASANAYSFYQSVQRGTQSKRCGQKRGLTDETAIIAIDANLSTDFSKDLGELFVTLVNRTA